MIDETIDPHTTRILENFGQQVRNRTLAEVYHNLKGKITTKDLATIYGVTEANISRIYRQHFPDHD